ncbi:putative L-gulonolactone oxidase 6 [Datura stramonium]|uniref:L-gulonolactone oxidase 6 n=1 Tax=Datura stramonium TaxID=4076 RepID=A0ABS8T1N4_DATST|nr:putative L-gulonolactone oxidase 6 [Datura stramonium]
MDHGLGLKFRGKSRVRSRLVLESRLGVGFRMRSRSGSKSWFRVGSWGRELGPRCEWWIDDCGTVTLKLEPIFKRSITISERSDSDLGENATTFGRQHEFADFTWYPSQRKVVYRIDDRVPANTPGNALNDFIGFRSTPSLVLTILRTSEENQESTNDAAGKCSSAKLTTSTLKIGAYGLTNNG